jgi:hypothetical protein
MRCRTGIKVLGVCTLRRGPEAPGNRSLHFSCIMPAQAISAYFHTASDRSVSARDVRRPRADHEQYLDHWLNVVKTDKKAIFTAASEASEAAAFLAVLVFRIKAKRGPLGAA